MKVVEWNEEINQQLINYLSLQPTCCNERVFKLHLIVLVIVWESSPRVTIGYKVGSYDRSFRVEIVDFLWNASSHIEIHSNQNRTIVDLLSLNKSGIVTIELVDCFKKKYEFTKDNNEANEVVMLKVMELGM